MQILKTIVIPKDTLLSFQKEVTNSLSVDVFNSTCTHFNKPSTLTFSNRSECINCENGIDGLGNVFFDKLVIQFKKGRLKQETHYYPFGLPITGLGSEEFNLMSNSHRYQGNECITESGLNWMSFGARQYDPQLGRFLGVDPLASIGGQERLSPFHAMGNNPVS